MSVYRDDLQCNVVSLLYDFKLKQGSLAMEENNYCDMDGCIKLFEAIDPRVAHIQTFAGFDIDTAYCLVGDEWLAKAPHERSFMR